MQDDVPADDEHLRPPGATDVEVEAAGLLSKALETVEVARGHLYTMHQMTGSADLLLDDAVDALRRAGRDDLAGMVHTEIRGRNVLAGRWTFQIVEEFDDGYYADFKQVERVVREELMQGRRHVAESEMKEDRRTRGRPNHEARPGPEC